MTRSEQPSLLPTDEVAPGKERLITFSSHSCPKAHLLEAHAVVGQRARIRCQIKASDLEEGSGDMPPHYGRTEVEEAASAVSSMPRANRGLSASPCCLWPPKASPL